MASKPINPKEKPRTIEKAASLTNIIDTKPVKKEDFFNINSLLSIKGLDLLKVLRDLHVFKGKDEHEFLALCESGELLANLINVLEGKEEKIKGIAKNPKTATAKTANVVKVLKYLRSFPKMSSNYI